MDVPPTITVAPHPLLDLRAFACRLATPLAAGDGEPCAQGDLLALLGAPEALGPSAPGRYRDLLRATGFKPAGRSKPCSEYLARAVPEGRLPRINLAVDVCNAMVFASGVPISVVDLDRLEGALSVRPAGDEAYVFNAAGQVIDVAGLLCLFDADGPCANAVKDSQRTKTGPGTTRTLSLIWGTNAEPGRAASTEAWYRRALEAAGATTVAVEFR